MFHTYTDKFQNTYQIDIDNKTPEFLMYNKTTKKWVKCGLIYKEEEKKVYRSYSIESSIEGPKWELRLCLSPDIPATLAIAVNDGKYFPLTRIADVKFSRESVVSFNNIETDNSQSIKQHLRQHKMMLEARWFEHRFLGMLFGNGYSKTRKIEEINKYLEDETSADMNVLSQGRTGKILSMA